jgi:hypothetical protein
MFQDPQDSLHHHVVTLDVCGPLSVFVQVRSLLNILYSTVYNTPVISWN